MELGIELLGSLLVQDYQVVHSLAEPMHLSPRPPKGTKAMNAQIIQSEGRQEGLSP